MQQALIFDTRIQQNGIIKIPELSNWLDYEVSIIIVRKPVRKIKEEVIKRKTYDSKELIARFNQVRQIKTGKTEVLTLDKAINIYDELTNISG